MTTKVKKMTRSRAERIFRNHIEPYHNCDVFTYSEYRSSRNPDGYGGRIWETIDRAPVEPLGENENGETEYENQSISWSDLKSDSLRSGDDIIRAIENGTPLYIVPRFLCYGDYDNSCHVERSNYRLFMAMYGGDGFSDDYDSEEGNSTYPGVHAMYGAYDSTGVAIVLETWLRYSEIRETIARLDDYPCIDDEDCSRVEMVLADEAWDNWARHDFQSELEKRFDVEQWRDYEGFDSDFRAWFEDCRESVNEYWEVESGGNAYVRIERIVEGIESVSWIPEYSYGKKCLRFFVDSFNDYEGNEE